MASPGPSSTPADATIGYQGGRPDNPASGGTAGRDHARLSNSSGFSIRIDPRLGIPVAVWSLTTAFGVLVFAVGLLPVRRRGDPERRRWRRSLARGRSAGERPGHDTAVDRVIADGSSGEIARHLVQQSSVGDAHAPVGLASVVREPLRFPAPPRTAVERRTIAYRSVRVADEPDDATSSEICRLDRGDEIEIIGEHEGFLRVRTPTGVEGWVQRLVIVG